MQAIHLTTVNQQFFRLMREVGRGEESLIIRRGCLSPGKTCRANPIPAGKPLDPLSPAAAGRLAPLLGL